MPAQEPSDERVQARRALAALPPGLTQATLVCPLCAHRVPARGLRALPAAGRPTWQLVFACPSCGLISPFDAARVTPERLAAVRGSPWTAQLRGFAPQPPASLLYTRRAGWRELAGTWAVAALAWLLLTGSLVPLDLGWGLVVSLAVAAATYRFAAIGMPAWALSPRRWLALGALLAEFARQLVVQNVTLSWRVLHPDLPIRPGIVVVPTGLRGDLALTVLGSLVTLTPDTVALDVDPERGLLYVHWIDVRATDPEKARRLITASLEEKIARWLD